MTIAGWLAIALDVVTALSLSWLFWLAGPLIYLGDSQPFESVGARSLPIAAILLTVAGKIVSRILGLRSAAVAIS